MDKKKRTPKSAALADAERSGLSVFRERFATDEKIREAAVRLVTRARQSNPKEAGVFGVLQFECHQVQTFSVEGEADHPYCLYDTALADDAAHAEAFQRVAGVAEEIRLERRRQLFRELEAKFIPVSLFRNGLLDDLAAPER